MSALSVSSPFPIFTAADGQPLENGYLWLGTANLDPQTNPITVYWDADLTIVAAQPIRTSGGYPANNGTPARLYVNSDYSIRVQNKNGTLVYSAPEATERFGGGIVNASQVVYDPSGTGAVATTVQTKLRETVSVEDFIPAGTITATTDCSAYINAALTAAAGKVLEFGAGQTYRANSTLTIKGNGTKILGRNATIDSYATSSALTCELTGGTTYLVNIDIEDFAIISQGVGAYAFRVLTSYSTYRRVSIALPVVNANGRGFFLPGDEANGTGPYYNTFIDCDVQSSSSGADHIGVSFSAIAPAYHSPNANTWIGGRVGQCLKNFVIKGNGNSFTNPASENSALTGTAFLFEADTALNCQQNYIYSCYIENANKGIEFTSSAKDNYVFGTFITGVTTSITDAGTGNSVISAIAAWKMPMGASFPTLSADTNALDYYGEGTWVPTLVGGTTAGSYTVTATGAKYTRIGNQVTITGRLDITVNTIGTGTARFGGLPFPKSSNTFLTGSINTTNITYGAGVLSLSPQIWTSSSDSTFAIAGIKSGTAPYDVAITDIVSGSVVYVTMTYLI